MKLVTFTIATVFALAVVPAAATAQAAGTAQEMALAALGAGQDTDYERATAAMDRGDYPQAMDLFQQIIDSGSGRSDAAAYWIAYALYMQGDHMAAIDSLRELRNRYPDSNWIDDSQFLEAEIRGAAGMPSAEQEAKDEMRMYALNALMHSAPERARPALAAILESDASLQTKRQALYVLMQAEDPGSVEVLMRVAATAEDRQLRVAALHGLGVTGGEAAGRALQQAYDDAADVETKRAVMEAWAIGATDASERLLAVARADPDEELRVAAIHTLAATGSAADLSDLYRGEPSQQVRRAVLEHMYMTGNLEGLAEIVRTERDVELRRHAIRGLGAVGIDGEEQAIKVRELLGSVYESGERGVRIAVLEAMSMSADIPGLIALFDKETDAELRRHIVTIVATSESPEAIEFLSRIIER